MEHNPKAFPRPCGRLSSEEHNLEQDGMTLRDWFAGQALAGILAAHTGKLSLPKDDQTATWAYGYADAMLAARQPKPHPLPVEDESAGPETT